MSKHLLTSLLLLCSVLSTYQLHSQGVSKRVDTSSSRTPLSAPAVAAPSATAAQDSLLLSDSLRTTKKQIPSVPLFEPMALHGSWNWAGTSIGYDIDRHEIQQEFYTSFDELLDRRVPGFSLSQGYYALPNTMRILGGAARDNDVLFDGRPMNDIGTSAGLMNLYPVEFMQKAEILLGSDAVVLADNASGMAMNIQEPRYNAKTPYTRLWYAEAANSYISSDGVFSQNIAPNLNMTLGYRREAGDGRYTNQAIDSWNLRALLRWNISASTNVSLVELFSNRWMGLNGGVDTAGTTDPNNELRAQVRMPLFNERVIRHDITLSLSSRLASDSSSRLHLGAYYSHALWHVGRDTSLLLGLDSALGLDWRSAQLGFNGRIEQDFLGHLRLSIGGEAELRSADSTEYYHSLSGLRLAAYAQTRISLSQDLALSGGARMQIVGSTTSINLGARADLSLSSHWNLLIDASQSARIASPSEGIDLKQEHSTLLFARVAYKDTSFSCSALAFTRLLVNTFVSSVVWDSVSGRIVDTRTVNGANRLVSGLVLDASMRMQRWFASAQLQSYATVYDGAADRLLPALSLRAAVEYRYPLGRNLLSLGLSTRARTAFMGETFVPQTWSYLTAGQEQAAALGGLDVNAGARIGDAFIKLAYQNILSNSYSTLSTFPGVVRNLSLSIAWTFFD